MSENVRKIKRLTRRQKLAINALLEYPTIEKVAASVGVNPRTVYRWLLDPTFKTELGRIEGERIDRATRRLIYLADLALDALEDVLNDPSQDGATNKRLAAATLLDNLLKLREHGEIDTRLIALEQAVYYGKP